MNLYSKSYISSPMSTQEKNHADALQRAEALLKKLEQRLDERTSTDRRKEQKISNKHTLPLNDRGDGRNRRLDS